MKKKEIIKRYILFIVGLFFLAIGVALTRLASLGMAPLTSIANVLSIYFTRVTIGNWLIILNCIFIAAQILILRKKFRLIQLMQIPLSVFFGYFTDFGVWLVSSIPNNTYAMKFALLIVGMIVISFGVSLTVIADVILNSGEALVKAISDTLNKNFGNVKVFVDISYVLTTCILSLIMFGDKIIGIREGTLISAVCMGLIVKFFCKRLTNPLTKILTK
ncbi:MAG: YitT family protein [Clostridia bacterium]|nr:YitT family protein [Clostridia bacterium]